MYCKRKIKQWDVVSTMRNVIVSHAFCACGQVLQHAVLAYGDSAADQHIMM
jgi:predicted nucleic acid-binding Zn finger protein